MTKMPSSTTTVEPAVAGETDDLSEGFIRKGEIFAPANAAVFEGNDEIVALGKDDSARRFRLHLKRPNVSASDAMPL